MANSLHIYGGDIHAGAQDGDMITNARTMALSGLRGNSVSKMFAFRAVSTTYPACAVRTHFEGPEAEMFEISLDGSHWQKTLNVGYIKDENILFFVRANIPEDADYGIHSSNVLVNEYLGGV